MSTAESYDEALRQATFAFHLAYLVYCQSMTGEPPTDEGFRLFMENEAPFEDWVNDATADAQRLLDAWRLPKRNGGV